MEKPELVRDPVEWRNSAQFLWISRLAIQAEVVFLSTRWPGTVLKSAKKCDQNRCHRMIRVIARRIILRRVTVCDAVRWPPTGCGKSQKDKGKTHIGKPDHQARKFRAFADRKNDEGRCRQKPQTNHKKDGPQKAESRFTHRVSDSILEVIEHEDQRRLSSRPTRNPTPAAMPTEAAGFWRTAVSVSS